MTKYLVECAVLALLAMFSLIVVKMVHAAPSASALGGMLY